MAATTKGRIVKPKNPSEGLALATKVYKKHVNDGATSELKNLDGYNWDTIGPTIQQAQDYHTAAEDFKGKMEEQYRLRDAAYKPIQEITDASSSYLKGKYKKNPKKLADWGYSIDDTPQQRKRKMLPGS